MLGSHSASPASPARASRRRSAPTSRRSPAVTAPATHSRARRSPSTVRRWMNASTATSTPLARVIRARNPITGGPPGAGPG